MIKDVEYVYVAGKGRRWVDGPPAYSRCGIHNTVLNLRYLRHYSIKPIAARRHRTVSNTHALSVACTNSHSRSWQPAKSLQAAYPSPLSLSFSPVLSPLYPFPPPTPTQNKGYNFVTGELQWPCSDAWCNIILVHYSCIFCCWRHVLISVIELRRRCFVKWW